MMGIWRYWLAFKLLLFFGGVYWCITVARRWRDDLQTVREPLEPVDRTIILGFWAATAVIVVLLLTVGLATLVEVFRMATDW